MNIDVSLLCLAGVIVGSLLPDIDHPQASINQRILPVHRGWAKFLFYGAIGCYILLNLSRQSYEYIPIGVFLILAGAAGHRGFTHHLAGIILFSVAAYLMASQIGYPLLFYGAILGYLLHCSADKLKSMLSI